MAEPRLDQTSPTPTPVPVPVPVAVPAPAPAASAKEQGELWRTVLKVAWMSIGLGIAIEILLLTLAAYAGTQGDSPRPFIADLAQKVSWAFLVCVGIAFGMAATKARPAVMGVLGFVSAPVAFTAAKSIHKGIGQALGLAAGGGALLTTFVIAGVKALEYAFLGAALGWLSRRAASLGAHAGFGLAAGIVFGGALVGLAAATAPQPLPAVDVAARAINEVVFPVGCALVIYAAQVMGKRAG